jgi:hypothetical protein
MEFKTAACGFLKMFLGIEIKEGKIPMRGKEFLSEVGATVACLLWMMVLEIHSGLKNGE